jgi:hypothetical protein
MLLPQFASNHAKAAYIIIGNLSIYERAALAMTGFPAISLPSAWQGKYFPCGSRRGNDATRCKKRDPGAAREFFSPLGEVFP